ncbi:MAG: ComF family protein [Clostridiales bacterium]|jgi:ComF family protein|nr:ComF family protein [Clostridiales bacterium]
MRLLTPLLDLLFPPRCIFCRGYLDGGQYSRDICQSCHDSLLDPAECCLRCCYPLSGVSHLCPACHDKTFSFQGTCALSVYQGNLKQVVHKYKYKGCRHFAPTLGRLAAAQVKRCNWPALHEIVPIPLHPLRLAERGYDQAFLLARAIGDELQLPVNQALVRIRPTPSQTRLHSLNRWDNVKNAFVVSPGLTLSGNILLVDDILTTGATAHNATEALLSAGAVNVYLTVVGR